MRCAICGLVCGLLSVGCGQDERDLGYVYWVCLLCVLSLPILDFGFLLLLKKKKKLEESGRVGSQCGGRGEGREEYGRRRRSVCVWCVLVVLVLDCCTEMNFQVNQESSTDSSGV